jgi:hypothetical protein
MHRDALPLAKMREPVIPLHCFEGHQAASSGSTRLYEDDGVSVGYQHGECAWTTITHRRESDWRQVVIEPGQGSFPGMPKMRILEVHLHGSAAPPMSVTLNGEVMQHSAGNDAIGWLHDAAARTLIVRLGPRPRSLRLRIEARS